MSDDWTAHQERHRALCARWGKPETADAGQALRLIGCRGVHPDEVHASRYASREAAEAFAASNLEHLASPSLGIVQDGDSWLGVTDLRPQLAALGGAKFRALRAAAQSRTDGRPR